MLHFLQVGAFLLCFCYRGALFTVGGLCDFFPLYNYRGLYAVFLVKQGLFHHVGALIFVFVGRGGIFWLPPSMKISAGTHEISIFSYMNNCARFRVYSNNILPFCLQNTHFFIEK